MNRTELNNAIYKVLTTQFKKDAKEEHKMVEEAGYEIYKCDGCFHVRNEKTWKMVYISSGYYRSYIHTNRDNYDFKWENPRPFDYVGYLNKATNYDGHNERYETSDAKMKYETMQYIKDRIRWREEDIDKIKKQLKKLTDDLEYNVGRLKEAEMELENTRKKYGLTA